jgi:hypothetical protein
MNILIFDTEYISISKSKSDMKSVLKYKNHTFPEIFQISFILIKKNNGNFHLIKKYIFNLETKQKISNRLKKLTHLKKKDFKNRINFFIFIKKIRKFFKNKVVFLSNGEDAKLLKMNLLNQNIKLKKKIRYINLRKISKLIYKKNLNTEYIKNKFKLGEIKSHNSLNDCFTIYNYLRHLNAKLGFKKLDKLLEDHIKELFL